MMEKNAVIDALLVVSKIYKFLSSRINLYESLEWKHEHELVYWMGEKLTPLGFRWILII